MPRREPRPARRPLVAGPERAPGRPALPAPPAEGEVVSEPQPPCRRHPTGGQHARRRAIGPNRFGAWPRGNCVVTAPAAWLASADGRQPPWRDAAEYGLLRLVQRGP